MVPACCHACYMSAEDLVCVTCIDLQWSVMIAGDQQCRLQACRLTPVALLADDEHQQPAETLLSCTMLKECLDE